MKNPANTDKLFIANIIGFESPIINSVAEVPIVASGITPPNRTVRNTSSANTSFEFCCILSKKDLLLALLISFFTDFFDLNTTFLTN